MKEQDKDYSKDRVIELLNGEKTHGFDHDKMFCFGGEYYLIEFLNCDKVSPFVSNPKYFAYNWRKFYSLWHSSIALGAKLILVNYSFKDERDKEDRNWSDMIKLLFITGFDYAALDEYLKKTAGMQDYKQKRKVHCKYLKGHYYKMRFDQFSEYYRALNSGAFGRELILPEKFIEEGEL